jgi:hypothetical protein
MFDFMRRSSPQHPTTAIQHALKEDGLFSNGGEAVELSVVESRDRYAGRTVRYFRVFDPARTSSRGLNIRSYKDLDAHPSLLLRTGHVEADGSVVIGHRGPSLDAAIPVRARADRSAHPSDERFVFPGSFRADAARA